MTGFFNIYKEEGEGSTHVVSVLKYLTGTPCGHMGTLDPLASGVLPVGVGKATRLFDYFLKKTKTYVARFRFGKTTDTLDREGTPEGEGRVPTEEEIRAVLPSLTGEIDQIPPKYSAKSVGGRRGYELARSGEEFELAPKRVTVYRFSLIKQTAVDEYEFEIVCGGGTYIRSLARDLALACGTIGYMSYLCRSQSGIFTLETAVPLKELTKENLEKYRIRTEDVLPFPVLKDVPEKAFHGIPSPVEVADGSYKIYYGEEFYGIAEVKDHLLRITTKLC